MNETRLSDFDTAAAPPPTLAGKYRIERIIGEGAFGRVYLATDTTLRRPVAVKELLVPRNGTDPETFCRHRERFEREARAGGAIAHPNVVTVHELHADAAGNLHLVMEYVDGTNLRDLLVQAHALPAPRAAAIALDIARGLEAVHNAGLVHRDLKPANVMISRRGAAKVGDFGVALDDTETQRVAPRIPARPASLPTAHPGTPLYMSPEQSGGTGNVDGRSDLYSLGLILHEMLTGERYLPRCVPLAAAKPDVPASLAALVGELLARDPAGRPQHASDVAARLAAFAATAATGSHPPDAPESLAPTQEGLFAPTMPAPRPAAAATPRRTTHIGRGGRIGRGAGVIGAAVALVFAAIGGMAAFANRDAAVVTATPNAAIAPDGRLYPTPTAFVISLGLAPAPPPALPASRPAAVATATATVPATVSATSAAPPRPAFASPTVPPPGTPAPGSVKLIPGPPLPAAPLPQVFAHPQGRYTFHYPQEAVRQPPGRLTDASFTLDSGMVLVSVSSDTAPFRMSEQELANSLVVGADREREVSEAGSVRIAGQPGVRLRYRTANERGVPFLNYVAAFSTENAVVYLRAIGDGDDEERFRRILPTLDAIAASFTTGAKLTETYTDPTGRFAFRYPERWRAAPPSVETQLGRVTDGTGTATFHVSVTDNLGSLTPKDFADRNIAAVSNPAYGLTRYMPLLATDTTINGEAAWHLAFAADTGDGVLREIHLWLIVKDGKGYSLTYRVPADKAREFADTGDVIAATFALR